MKGSIDDEPWKKQEVQAELDGEMTKWMKAWMASVLLVTLSVLFGISYVVWLLLNHFGVLMAGVPL
jgi:uncharacterized membrane protein